MNRFLFFFVTCLILGGLVIYFGYDRSFLKWVGKLPGDFIFKKGDVRIYFPIVSSLIVSLICTFIFKPKK